MKINWSEIERHWERLRDRTGFDLSIPCVVVSQEVNAMETTLSGLSNHLKVSAAMSSPQVKRYIELTKEIGAEKAMNTLLMDEEGGEEFALLWSEAKKDLANGAIATVDDLVASVNTAKKGFNEYPRRILVVQINQKDCDVLLVGPPSDDIDI
ncbi:hypothetical protein OAA10_00280 [bacterium]|nr:hypothetical protein [bacterium]